MSVWIVRCVPTAALRAGHLGEARRAFARASRDVDDDALHDALWVSRALPAALDVLSDARAELDVSEVRLSRFRVERRRPAEPPLVALSIYTRGADVVEVRFLPQKMLDEPMPREDCPVIVRMQVAAPLRRQIAGDDERTRADEEEPHPVIVRRFTHGKT